ncbi:unnamed protein product [Ranitomeya imitator]|uniref:PSI domain-containing protein n=1 Tax=Ranitomeya imitator TaxID=111125 RepID=A0ABN9LYP6_9NEOB|nr:unnamed protein product [Ranitomeya imitator]
MALAGKMAVNHRRFITKKIRRSSNVQRIRTVRDQNKDNERGVKCTAQEWMLPAVLSCDEWKVLQKPNLHRDVNRFGHSAVVSNGSSAPARYKASVVCGTGGYCVSWETAHASSSLSRAHCPNKSAPADDRCYKNTDCASCTANTNGCQWCDDKKCMSLSSNCSMSVKNYVKCYVRNEQICNKLTSCKSCSLNLNCQWDQRQQECQALPAHLCGEGWSHVGDACLRFNSSRDSYDNARVYCHNLSGSLASLTTPKEVDFVLDEMQKYTVQPISGIIPEIAFIWRQRLKRPSG